MKLASLREFLCCTYQVPYDNNEIKTSKLFLRLFCAKNVAKMKLKTSDLFIRLQTLRITLQDLVFCLDLYREAGFCSIV